MRRERVLETLFGLFYFLFFRISSWMCSIPAWGTLLLHFTVGLPIYWFWLTLAAWIAAGLIRFALIGFARWSSSSPDPVKKNVNPYSVRQNKNPYSAKNDIELKK